MRVVRTTAAAVALVLAITALPALAQAVSFAGMTLAGLSEEQRSVVENVYGEPAGVLVTAVAADSLAEQTCIAAGDILLSVRLPNHTDYYPLAPSVEALAQEPWLANPSDKMRLMIVRREDAEWVVLKAVLGQAIGSEVPEGLLEGNEGELQTYEAGKGYVFAPADPNAVLAKAPNGAELLARDADMWGALLAWSYGTSLTEEQRRVVSTGLAVSWQNAAPGEVNAFATNFRTGPQQIPQLSAQQKESARAYYTNGFMQMARQAPGTPLSQLVLQVSDRSRQVLASAGAGVDLTQQDVDAFLEYIMFQVQMATGQPVSLSPEQHQQLTQQVIGEFNRATPDQQQVLANMAVLWARLRTQWDKLQADQANALAQQWQQAHQQQAGQGAVGQPAPAGDGSHLTPETMDLLKDVMRMDHETSMTIINNIGGGGPTTDVYDSDGIYLYSY